MAKEIISDYKVTIGPEENSAEVYGFYLEDGAMVCITHGQMDEALEGATLKPITDKAEYTGCVICALPDEE